MQNTLQRWENAAKSSFEKIRTEQVSTYRKESFRYRNRKSPSEGLPLIGNVVLSKESIIGIIMYMNSPMNSSFEFMNSSVRANGKPIFRSNKKENTKRFNDFRQERDLKYRTAMLESLSELSRKEMAEGLHQENLKRLKKRSDNEKKLVPVKRDLFLNFDKAEVKNILHEAFNGVIAIRTVICKALGGESEDDIKNAKKYGWEDFFKNADNKKAFETVAAEAIEHIGYEVSKSWIVLKFLPDVAHLYVLTQMQFAYIDEVQKTISGRVNANTPFTTKWVNAGVRTLESLPSIVVTNGWNTNKISKKESKEEMETAMKKFAVKYGIKDNGMQSIFDELTQKIRFYCELRNGGNKRRQRGQNPPTTNENSARPTNRNEAENKQSAPQNVQQNKPPPSKGQDNNDLFN